MLVKYNREQNHFLFKYSLRKSVFYKPIFVLRKRKFPKRISAHEFKQEHVQKGCFTFYFVLMYPKNKKQITTKNI